jgi:glucuronokinase
VRWQTTIPRSVGLGGSSAIVVATLRALCAAHEVTIAPIETARLALAIEVEDLGIAAGWQDRIAQTHDGLTFMDFSADPPSATSLDPAALPPVLVAWRSDTGGNSGAVHAPLRDRHAEGDPAVRRAIERLADAARRAAAAVAAGDHAALCAGVDDSFDARRSMLTLDPRHVEMVQTARAAGAAANYAGSGGAIVAVCADPDHREQVEEALTGIGCATLASGQGRPRRSPPHDPTSVT